MPGDIAFTDQPDLKDRLILFQAVREHARPRPRSVE